MIRKGTSVKWKWGKSYAKGEVTEVFHEDVERQINGSKVKREATKDSPTYLITQSDGQEVLKSQTEVERDKG